MEGRNMVCRVVNTSDINNAINFFFYKINDVINLSKTIKQLHKHKFKYKIKKGSLQAYFFSNICRIILE